jgi:hypothetical protein
MLISRATMAFCWLPPLIDRTRVAHPWLERMSYWEINASPVLTNASRWRTPWVQYGLW